jgi:hypothetical protein
VRIGRANALNERVGANLNVPPRIQTVETIATELSGAQILALHIRLQVSLQTTSMFYKLSLVNYM